jgi:hypothetical protein
MSREPSASTFVVQCMSPYDDYLKKAAECLAHARRAPDDKDRLFLVELAAKWRDLAESAQRIEVFVVYLAGIDGPTPSESSNERLEASTRA